MTKSAWQRLFAKATWRGWRERLRQWEQAMNYDDIDLLERRIRQLELQVCELQKKVR
ncbi:hypothetical protein [Ancylobacter radicis]|uniref:CsbD family protein n=1 Tax=Ancylobacter radicis TaxID=2836179 RepID=A0ABS5R5F8_9HYPH|nr:hypothetical protein [Ancylobacter radicis]MBS9476889.1 hypothetical protein [Ancylobacter radicis]